MSFPTDLSKYKVISFDIFDTLIVRSVLHPVDIFAIMEDMENIPDFYNKRQVAEHLARFRHRKSHKANKRNDISFDEIYQTLQENTGFDDAKIARLKGLELKLELDYTSPRETVQNFFKRAKKEGKKVIIVTDMYLHRPFIEELLEKNGINGHDKLYISGENRKTKSSGEAFDFILQDLKIKPSEMLHVGDNEHSDIKMAKKKGIATLHTPSVASIFATYIEAFSLFRLDYKTLKDTSFAVSQMVNMLCDDPFIMKNKKTPEFEQKFYGYNMAIVTLSLGNFIIKDMGQRGIKDLFCIWRDGYLLFEMYQILSKYCKLPINLHKIFLNRSIRDSLFIETEFDIFLKTCTVFFVAPLRDFIEKKCYLNEEEQQFVIKELKKQGVDVDYVKYNFYEKYEFILPFKDLIIKRAREKNKIVKSYLEKETKGLGKVAFFDLGRRGRFMNYLNQTLEPKNIHGYQLLHSEKEIENLTSYAYIPENQLLIDNKHFFILFLEGIFCSNEGSVKDINEKFEFTFSKQELPQKEQEFFTGAQKYAFEYIENFGKNFGNRSLDMEIHAGFVLEALGSRRQIKALNLEYLASLIFPLGGNVALPVFSFVPDLENTGTAHLFVFNPKRFKLLAKMKYEFIMLITLFSFTKNPKKRLDKIIRRRYKKGIPKYLRMSYYLHKLLKPYIRKIKN